MRNGESNYPIDIVIPWVDGNDPAWLEQKAKYSGEITTSVRRFDYQEWGLLKYWFRGIEECAPWVRNVFFITWGHIPEWLNTNNQKLRIVNHKDYIPGEYLPTFSSHTIELNFHRIEGLAEHFVYFNDDMYLVNKTKPDDFFFNGLPREVAIVNPIAPSQRYYINNVQLTSIAVINEHYRKHEVIRKNPTKWINLKYGKLLPLNILFAPWGRFPGLLQQHIAASYLKSTFVEVWRQEPELLHDTCAHRFRDFKCDVNQWIMQEWQIANGKFEPRKLNFGKYYQIKDRETAKKAGKAILSGKYKTICLNDHIESNQEIVVDCLKKAFEERFPVKSSFEY